MGGNGHGMYSECHIGITGKDGFRILTMQGGEQTVGNAKVLNICWKPLFAALMTGILSQATQIHPILIGGMLGIAAAISCYMEVNRLLRDKGV